MNQWKNKSLDLVENRETKFSPVTIEEVDLAGRFNGYASVFGEVDMGNDIVARGAFSKFLRTHSPASIRMLFQHNPDEPVGVWEEIREDAKGLHVTGVLSTKTSRGRELIELMRQGAIDGLSIGFKTVRSKKNNASAVRTILEAELWEISIVTFPMQANARVEAIKHVELNGQLPTTRQFERWLTRDVGLSRSEARTVIAKGFTQLAGKRDAAIQSKACLADSIRQAAHLMAADAASYRRI
ncbi:MAG: HK97 family phage prohead protease [Rhizobiaceae bacterium]|nr:HK97 family phage prohead protease [Rhizobiaceae bacterium]